MQADDGLGDDEPIPPLLPPADRLWRHPSEIADHPLPAMPLVPQASRVWPAALLSGAVGALRLARRRGRRRGGGPSA